ncbi:hypothetical protein HDU86_008496 [Geranomyces michiganensis]|nr:hypothetical protein HDU86_008496 [Geranomyces michiganensis]
MSAPEKFSLWLVPDEPLALQNIIFSLSNELGTPSWSPHITLLGGITTTRERAGEIAPEVAAGGKSFEVTLVEVTSQPTYFQAITATPSSSSELLALNAHAVATLGPLAREQQSFRPHLSLVYGDLDANAKHQLVARLNSPEAHVIGATVRIGKLQMWAIRENVDDWEMVAECSFPDAQ